eukprot:1138678-Pelagomonas_calceolata.AAC.14
MHVTGMNEGYYLQEKLLIWPFPVAKPSIHLKKTQGPHLVPWQASQHAPFYSHAGDVPRLVLKLNQDGIPQAPLHVAISPESLLLQLIQQIRGGHVSKVLVLGIYLSEEFHAEAKRCLVRANM